MPRRARIDYPGALHHVIGRGIERKFIFNQDKDKCEFQRRLTDNLTKSSMQCYAWCIMGNHFHLLLQTGTTSLAEFMRSLLTGYAVYYNMVHKRSGHLFQNRYQSTVCDKDSYLLSLVRYIHLNPVKANVISYTDLRKYRWTGHREILESNEEGLIDREAMLSLLGQREKESIKRYSNFIKDGLNINEDFEGGGLFRSGGGKWAVRKRKADEREMYDDRILGEGDFVEKVLEMAEEDDKEQREIKSIDDLLKRVSQYYRVAKEDILDTREKSVREARKITVYMGSKYLGKTMVEMGRLLGITKEASSIAKKGGREIFKKGRLKSQILK